MENYESVWQHKSRLSLVNSWFLLFLSRLIPSSSWKLLKEFWRKRAKEKLIISLMGPLCEALSNRCRYARPWEISYNRIRSRSRHVRLVSLSNRSVPSVSSYGGLITRWNFITNTMANEIELRSLCSGTLELGITGLSFASFWFWGNFLRK